MEKNAKLCPLRAEIKTTGSDIASDDATSDHNSRSQTHFMPCYGPECMSWDEHTDTCLYFTRAWLAAHKTVKAGEL